MTQDDLTVWEAAVLDGGPAHGLRVRVPGRPLVLQVTRPCVIEGDADELVHALHLYRRDVVSMDDTAAPVRYRFDAASP
ncbi:hypothetical protein [Yinghuangia seranimata]|uniref:hypothetical protein n=1 Tax=Yinghuangia seranimata TaxID=408067 RepID=UPI00248B1B0B|nr:hypothetical protein [Yinghuangia seranimata]MDI2129580.1 hypothetical protein [Yinghuangia seranimata]